MPFLLPGCHTQGGRLLKKICMGRKHMSKFKSTKMEFLPNGSLDWTVRPQTVGSRASGLKYLLLDILGNSSELLCSNICGS